MFVLHSARSICLACDTTHTPQETLHRRTISFNSRRTSISRLQYRLLTATHTPQETLPGMTIPVQPPAYEYQSTPVSTADAFGTCVKRQEELRVRRSGVLQDVNNGDQAHRYLSQVPKPRRVSDDTRKNQSSSVTVSST